MLFYFIKRVFELKSYFFCIAAKKMSIQSLEKNLIVKVISALIQCVQLASIHALFPCIWYLYIQRKTTKKFNFELLCLFYGPYDIQLLNVFLRRAEGYFFLQDCYVLGLTIEGLNIANYQKMFYICHHIYFNGKLLLIVLYYIHGIAQYISKICLIFKWSPIVHFKLSNYQLMFYFCCGYIIPA